MKHLKIIFLILIMSLLSGLCRCQSMMDKGANIQFCAAGTLLNTKDQIISKLRYKGHAPGISLSIHQNDKNDFYFADLNYEKGFYSSKGYFNSGMKRIDHLGLRAQLAYFRSFRERKRGLQWQFFFGGLLSGLVDRNEVLDFSNSRNLTYVFLDIAPSIAARRPFRLFNRNCQFSGLLSIPIAAYTWTPQYGVPYFNGRYYSRFQSFGHYFRIRTRAALHCELSASAKAFFLSYEWDYRQLSSKNKVQNAAQRFAIGLLIYIL